MRVLLQDQSLWAERGKIARATVWFILEAIEYWIGSRHRVTIEFGTTTADDACFNLRIIFVFNINQILSRVHMTRWRAFVRFHSWYGPAANLKDLNQTMLLLYRHQKSVLSQVAYKLQLREIKILDKII